MGYTVIFGGTFNPFHIGHFEMLEALNSLLEVEEIFLLPDKIPPHKECDFLASDEHRIEMCRLAAEKFSKVKLCLAEFEREGKSYSYDTVVYLSKKYPEKHFAFACGGDMLATLDKWYRYEELIKLLPFFAFMREDITESLFRSQTELLRKKGAEIFIVDKKITCVSSTFIRNNIDLSGDLVPKKIYDYIKAEGIYSGN